MGGMQALQWIVEFPISWKRPSSLQPLPGTMLKPLPSTKSAGVRYAEIVSGSRETTDGEGPREGLAVARMMAHITYLSDEGMEERFGRRSGIQGQEL